MHACMHMHVNNRRRQRRALDAPGNGGAGGVELPDLDAGSLA